MNEHVRLRRHSRTPTRAAEGLARWRWTTAEVEAMAEAGILAEDDRLELIGGELVPMSPKGARHEIVRLELAQALRRRLGNDVRVAEETQLNLSSDTFSNPDILVHAAATKAPYVKGDAALLVIEVADASRDLDLGPKAKLYAAFAVREYWVVDAKTLVTRVHREPDAAGYRTITEVAPEAPLTPIALAGIVLRLAELDLG